MENNKKNSSIDSRQSTKRHWVILFLIGFMFVFSITNVSAFQFDNVKSYDEQTKTATIKNLFGLGKSYAEITLLSPQEVVVPPTYTNVSMFEIKGFNDYADFIQQIKMYNLRQGNFLMNKHYDLKYWGDKIVDDYKNECNPSTSPNGTITESCQRVISGNHTEKGWIDLSVKDIKQNDDLIIGVFVNALQGEKVEWIPNFAGVEVEEWAFYTADIKVGLVSCWTLDGTSGDFIDYGLGQQNNLTILGSGVTRGIPSETASLGNASYFDGTSIAINSSNYVGLHPSGDFTLIVVTNSSNGQSNKVLAGAGTSTTGHGYSINPESDLRFVSYLYTTDAYSIKGVSDFSTGNDVMASVVYDAGVGAYIYVNGTNVTQARSGTFGALESAQYPFAIGGSGFVSTVNFTGYISEVVYLNISLNSTQQSYIWNGGDIISCRSQDVLTTDLSYPADTSIFSTNSINFSGIVQDPNNVGVYNVSLLINGTINQTNSSHYVSPYFWNLTNFPEGDWNWTIETYDNETKIATAVNGTLTFSVDTIPPVVNNDNISDIATYTLPTNLIWKYDASDSHLSYCYYNSTEDSTYTIITCNSPISTSFTSEGNKTIQYCANDTFGSESCGVGYSYVTLINISQADNPDPTGEGGTVTFNLTINSTSIPSTTATLHLNHTLYAADTIISGTNGYIFQVDVDIPEGWGNSTGSFIDWFWNYSISGLVTNASTSTTNLTVYSLEVDDCSVFTDLILNMTLNDESTAVFLDPTIINTSIEIDLNISSKQNSSLGVQYSNTYLNVSYAEVCVPTGLLTNSDYRIDIVSEYSATAYADEFFYLDNGTLNSSSFFDSYTNKTTNLYDLLLTDSTTFLFSFLDQDNVQVPDAIVHTFRQYIGEGLFREIERGKQDDNGETHLHLVEEDVIYFFKITLNGELLYTSSTYNAKCLSSPCQIELTASQGSIEFGTNFTTTDGTYAIIPYPNSRTVGLTFSLSTPSEMNLTIAKQDYQGSYTIVDSDSVTSTGSSINISIPQAAGNVTFYAIVYQDGEFVGYKLLNLQDAGYNYFGATGLIMASLMILTLGLMAIFEGAGVIIFLIFGLIIAAAMKVINLGYYSLIGVICAFIILIFKLVQRKR